MYTHLILDPRNNANKNTNVWDKKISILGSSCFIYRNLYILQSCSFLFIQLHLQYLNPEEWHEPLKPDRLKMWFLYWFMKFYEIVPIELGSETNPYSK